MVDRKEKYKFDLGVKQLRLSGDLGLVPNVSITFNG